MDRLEQLSELQLALKYKLCLSLSVSKFRNLNILIRTLIKLDKVVNSWTDLNAQQLITQSLNLNIDCELLNCSSRRFP